MSNNYLDCFINKLNIDIIFYFSEGLFSEDGQSLYLLQSINNSRNLK
jgi:hypothetical protein